MEQLNEADESKLISELQELVENDSIQASTLLNYNKQYLISKSQYEKLCAICEEWQAMDLPYDCLSNPSYCLKKENDRSIIRLYEELENQILNRP